MTTKEHIADHYKYGKCYFMAIALHRHFGLKIGALVVDVPSDYSLTKRWPHPVHAYGIADDGQFMDAGGMTTAEGLKAEYLDNTRRTFWDPEYLEFDSEADFREFLHRTLAGPIISTGLPGEELEICSSFEATLEEQIPKALDAIPVLELDELIMQNAMRM